MQITLHWSVRIIEQTPLEKPFGRNRLAEIAPTRMSLLLRLRDGGDSDAWSQFVDIYGVLVFNFARRHGWHDADAADLVQEVLIEVSKSIGRFNYDPKVGKFRSWIYKITKRTASRLQDRQQRLPTGTGDSGVQEMLQQVPDGPSDLERFWEQEYERQLLLRVSERIRDDVNASTWQAFWQTAVEGKSPQSVASELGLSVGSVYVARNRVMKRLTIEAREFDDYQ